MLVQVVSGNRPMNAPLLLACEDSVSDANLTSNGHLTETLSLENPIATSHSSFHCRSNRLEPVRQAKQSSKINQKSRFRRKMIREVAPVYWRRLIEVGVPIDSARIIAWAIARYDAATKLPEPAEKALIRRYCRYICRADLWSAGLLLEPSWLEDNWREMQWLRVRSQLFDLFQSPTTAIVTPINTTTAPINTSELGASSNTM